MKDQRHFSATPSADCALANSLERGMCQLNTEATCHLGAIGTKSS